MIKVFISITCLFLLAGSVHAQNRKYVGVWSSGSDSNLVTKSKDWTNFLAKGEELTGKGLRLVDVETFKVDGTRKYVGVWSSGSGSSRITKSKN
ncbi:MAG: hypothetical protein V3T84_05195 [Phycisphaerales bacterium]